MSHCAVIENDYLKITVDSVESCTGFVILDKAEYLSYQTYHEFLLMPTQDELISSFNLAFESVVVLYVACYGIMKIVQILRS